MGQKPLGPVPKEKQVNIRLDADEHAMLQRKSGRLGLDNSKYFRKLLKDAPE
ncbi:ribbon-helix-helix DNA binding domain protein [Microbacterium phage Mashley]|uniref:DNA binding domain protein n=3 Tax=Squashvirus TaxID=2733215 RepID=A0A2U8UJ00_9CAUD|nr:DNA binding domain protein [Microbacterium phage Hyperion]YP_009801756.1 DNA binding domain protein [Microbacterium phage Squash]QED11829.1 ribbon-helix-helix DNA binding domain protein [Microbacterium phage Mashley]QNL29983.1 ribbon-helix-helix DNA binding domain protein [Microbacterium phage Casend]QQO39195.1 ribbon-helix-helix DNA binding domain protein [Microbacterium phage Rudy]QQO39416.1 ribbon-helix-helix DNA binding domain protein [Microbacterium phage Namago]QQO39524.1 ribbon-heli